MINKIKYLLSIAIITIWLTPNICLSSYPIENKVVNLNSIEKGIIKDSLLSSIIDSIVSHNNNDVPNKKVYPYIIDKQTYYDEHEIYAIYSFSYVSNLDLDASMDNRKIGIIVMDNNPNKLTKARLIFYPIDSIVVWDEHQNSWDSYELENNKILYRASGTKVNNDRGIKGDNYYLFDEVEFRKIGSIKTSYATMMRGDKILSKIEGYRRYIGKLNILNDEGNKYISRFYYEVDLQKRDENGDVYEEINQYEEYIVDDDTLILNREISIDEWEAMYGID